MKINNILNYSIYNMIKESYENRESIENYYKNRVEDNSIETKENFTLENEDKLRIIGLNIGLFVTIFILNFFILIFSIFLLIKEWENIDFGVKILSIFFILAGLPIISILLIIFMKKKETQIL